MIWTDEDLDAAREMQRRKLEYAKELEQQIELRRATQREQQQQLEEFERKFQPDDRSPAKWLVDGGYTSSSYRSPFRFPPQSSPSAQQQQQPQHHFDDRDGNDGPFFGARATASSSLPLAGEPSGAPSVERDSANSQHPRFRITDLQDLNDRQRERAQQLEWRRILDEQVRENARLKQQEDEARRRDDAGEAREEMLLMRDLQLRAQRRMGLPEIASEPSPTYRHVPAASPSRQHEPVNEREYHSPDYHLQPALHGYEPLRHGESVYAMNDPHRPNRHLHDVDTMAMAMPPPAPSRFTHAPPNAMQSPARPAPSRESVEPFDGSRSVVIHEYRALLAEIRREREELRVEKEELRNEKEALRLERTRLQLENERMASLVDMQRRLSEQQLERQAREQQLYHQQQQQQQQQHQIGVRSPVRGDSAPLPSAQRPLAFDLSQIHDAERSIAALEFGSRSAKTPRATDRRPSAMSMADFAVPQNRLTPNVIDSPRLRRLPQFRLRPAAVEDDDDDDDKDASALDQSLAGESVFVALCPEEIAHAASHGPPRITATASPRRSASRGSSEHNELRSSRVIKSRGFYNIESEANAFPTRTERSTAARERKSRRHSSRKSPHSVDKARTVRDAADTLNDADARARRFSSPSGAESRSRHDHGRHRQPESLSASDAHKASSLRVSRAEESRYGKNAEEEEDEEPEFSRSLFEVKVLV